VEVLLVLELLSRGTVVWHEVNKTLPRTMRRAEMRSLFIE
jgi:hypothetical protein